MTKYEEVKARLEKLEDCEEVRKHLKMLEENKEYAHSLTCKRTSDTFVSVEQYMRETNGGNFDFSVLDFLEQQYARTK